MTISPTLIAALEAANISEEQLDAATQAHLLDRVIEWMIEWGYVIPPMRPLIVEHLLRSLAEQAACNGVIKPS